MSSTRASLWYLQYCQPIARCPPPSTPYPLRSIPGQFTRSPAALHHCFRIWLGQRAYPSPRVRAEQPTRSHRTRQLTTSACSVHNLTLVLVTVLAFPAKVFRRPDQSLDHVLETARVLSAVIGSARWWSGLPCRSGVGLVAEALLGRTYNTFGEILLHYTGARFG